MKDYVKINKDAYDKLEDHYRNRRYNKSEFEESAEKLGMSVLKHLPSRHNQIKVLEIGPGSGEILSFFDKKNCKTTAIEISEKIINVAKEVSPNTIFINDDILNVELPIGEFDIIYAGALIHLFSKDDAVIILNKLLSWMKDDGLLFINTTISEFSKEGVFFKSDAADNVKRFRKFWKENEFIFQINEANFCVIEVMYSNEFDRGKKWIGLICSKFTSTFFESSIPIDRVVFKCPNIEVVKRKITIKARSLEFDVVKRRKVAIVIPILSNGSILFVRQFRSAVSQEIIEFPGGKVDDEEPIELAAKRELLEETGYFSNDLCLIKELYSSPHFSDETIYVFIAKNLIKRSKNVQPEEFIQNAFFDMNYVLSPDFTKKILDAKTLVAYYSFLEIIKN